MALVNPTYQAAHPSRREGRSAGRVVAGYGRISSDDARHAREREGIANQERWFREWAEVTFPGAPTRFYADNDVSGAKERDDFEALQQAISRGEVVHVWTRDQSRFQRDEEIWFKFKRVMMDAGIYQFHTKDEGLVAVDSLVTSIYACVDADRRRTDRKHLMDRQLEDAKAGRPPSGSLPPWFRRVTKGGERTLEIVPEKAEMARSWAAEILGGRSATSLARELQRQGVTGAQGKVIRTSAQVEQPLTAYVTVGVRVHNGVTYPGNWEPVLDEETWHALRATIAARRREATADGEGRGGKARRRYLLSGSLSCECGNRFSGRRKLQRGGHVLTYFCTDCKTQVMAEPVDAYVLDKVAAELAEISELADMLNTSDTTGRQQELRGLLSGIEARSSELAAEWADPDGDLTSNEWKAARQALHKRREALETELAHLVAEEATDDPEATEHAFAEAWETWETSTDETEWLKALEALQAIISKSVAEMTVAPAGRGQRIPPTDRLTIIMRREDG